MVVLVMDPRPRDLMKTLVVHVCDRAPHKRQSHRDVMEVISKDAKPFLVGEVMRLDEVTRL